jgi:DNA-binding NarL/FixJ family response regulator
MDTTIKPLMDTLTVLVVDDAKVVRERLVEMLAEVAKVGAIHQAWSVRSAMELIRLTEPEIVVLDIHLPDPENRSSSTNGIDVLLKIKEQKGNDPLPKVIMLTNLTYPQYRRLCARYGADYFLDKSSDFERLPEVISELADEILEDRASTFPA